MNKRETGDLRDRLLAARWRPRCTSGCKAEKGKEEHEEEEVEEPQRIHLQDETCITMNNEHKHKLVRGGHSRQEPHTPLSLPPKKDEYSLRFDDDS
mmetsp:Transcript_27132/g.37876  ORF Transcript_27132/g.37876 Transcript_27132/m.37876 type:complete len:96 (+) Transcript_27132:707-994(+)